MTNTTVGPGFGTAYQNATALWRLNYNAIDLEMGRSYFVSKRLSLRPQIGLRTAWLYQEFKTAFSNAFGFLLDSRLFAKDKYWGVDPRAGIISDWKLGYGLSVFGNLAGSLLYGRTRMKYLFQLEELLTSIFSPFTQHNDKFSQICPQVQMKLGFSWGQCFQDWFFFALNASWEVNYYWNRMNLPLEIITPHPLANTTTMFPGITNKPVSMEGVTFSAKLDF